jgi:hypothetical protein
MVLCVWFRIIVAALADGRSVWNAYRAEMGVAEEYKDEGLMNAGAAACTGFEGYDLDRDWVVDPDGEMDPREKFV